MKVKTHTLNGRRYKIEFWPDTDGIIDLYAINENDRAISIFAKPKTKAELITILHECLHAENWHTTEATVDRVSKEISSLLWRLGYRRK